ncbi:MAG TPA: alpha/beta hydrolase [Puia sp.]|nr:alpha/beta hydrolase [Puia sp.]
MQKLLILFLLLMAVSCTKQQINPDSAGSLIETDSLNVSYGIDPAQKFDMWLPANRSSDTTKVLIMIHGGGWTSGDKSDFSSNIGAVQQLLPGYAIFSINYRLATDNTNKFPAQENDVKSAIEFIYNRRNEFYISDKFVLLGASAGGHLALLQAYKNSSLVKPKAVVAFFAPIDLAALYNNPPSIATPLALLEATGTIPSVNPDIYNQSSPINFVSDQSCATILLQGGLDPLVSPSQSASLQALLQQKNVINQLVYYPNEGHGWTGPDLVDSYQKIQTFLYTNVH